MVPATVSHGKKSLVSLQFILEEPLDCFLVHPLAVMLLPRQFLSFYRMPGRFLGSVIVLLQFSLVTAQHVTMIYPGCPALCNP